MDGYYDWIYHDKDLAFISYCVRAHLSFLFDSSLIYLVYQDAFPWSSFEQRLHCFLSPRQLHTSPSLGFFPLFLQFGTLIEEVLECFLSLVQSGQRLVRAECRLAMPPATQECPTRSLIRVAVDSLPITLYRVEGQNFSGGSSIRPGIIRCSSHHRLSLSLAIRRYSSSVRRCIASFKIPPNVLVSYAIPQKTVHGRLH